MTAQHDLNEIKTTIFSIVKNLQSNEEEWVTFASIGIALSNEEIDIKLYGHHKLKFFLNQFSDILEFDIKTEEGKPPVRYARCKTDIDTLSETSKHIDATRANSEKKTDLYSWGFINASKYEQLSELALSEKWDFSECFGNTSPKLHILKNYIAHTFKRLCHEGKICYAIDKSNNDEYAAFNTGLVDKGYEYIYALFKKNTKYEGHSWYLLDFTVTGSDTVGKTLGRFFFPLPARADYFQNKIERLVYNYMRNTSPIRYDYILTERLESFPTDFLKTRCYTDQETSQEFLTIDDHDIDSIQESGLKSSKKKEYFSKLGRKISEQSAVLDQLRSSLMTAVKSAQKEAEWNYKIALPAYNTAKEMSSLLLPLRLVDENRVDLVLAVTVAESGSYLGHTILPLNLAYMNSRLVARMDNTWLTIDSI